MFRASLLALVTALVVLSGGLVGQDPKKEDKKPDEKKALESKSVEKKDEPATKLKGVLPPNWKKLGLTDDQVQKIYKVQNKYDDEIDKLQAQIARLKTERTKDMHGVLTADQKKRLDDILTGKEK